MKPIILSIPRYQTERLLTHAFPAERTGAGRIIRWDTPKEVIDDLEDYLLADIRIAIENNESVCSYQFCDRVPVGWSSTTPLSKAMGSLEPRRLNRCADALFVTSEKELAPLTTLITIVYEVIEREQDFLVLVHSMYPGPDIGELSDNVSEREGVVFFPWGHPGE